MEIRTLGEFPVTDASQVAEARRFAGILARGIRLGEAEIARLGVVVTEAATNLLKHAQGGDLIFSSISSSDRAGFAVLSVDRGPGIANVAASLADGYSTKGSPGTGLGAITRMASQFDIYSSPAGTVLLAVLWSGSPPEHPSSPLETGAISLPKPGEEVSGDAWSMRSDGPRVQILVADGLGHGIDANQASLEAVKIFSGTHGEPAEILDTIHMGLYHTRGAAVSIAEIDTSARAIRYAGLGNICGVVIAPERIYNLVAHNGTAGLEARRIQQFSYPWPAGSLLLLHSDGLSQRTRALEDPALRLRHPMVIAAVLYRDGRRQGDDATVIVGRDISVGGAP